jgi:hypothetical protein
MGALQQYIHVMVQMQKMFLNLYIEILPLIHSLFQYITKSQETYLNVTHGLESCEYKHECQPQNIDIEEFAVYIHF